MQPAVNHTAHPARFPGEAGAWERYAAAMLSDDDRQALLDELVRVHGCHTVVLYGSRARGDATPASDFDVLGIRDAGPNLRDARPWRGTFLDAFVAAASTLETPGDEELKLLGGAVLLERDGLGSQLLAKVDAHFRRGPAPLPEDQANMLRVWARKMVARIRLGDAEGQYRRVWLLYELLEDYFKLRGRWYLGPKLALRELAASDPQTSALYLEALEPGASLDVVAALVERVVG